MVRIQDAPPLGEKENLLVWMAENNIRLENQSSLSRKDEYKLRRKSKSDGVKPPRFGDQVADVFDIENEQDKKELNKKIEKKREDLNLE